MDLLAELFKEHRNTLIILMLASSASTWFFNNVATALVGNLPAPTATSTPEYRYWFSVANQLVGNKQRAKSTSIENSPNFAPAVQKLLSQYGVALPPEALQVPGDSPKP